MLELLAPLFIRPGFRLWRLGKPSLLLFPTRCCILTAQVVEFLRFPRSCRSQHLHPPLKRDFGVKKTAVPPAAVPR